MFAEYTELVVRCYEEKRASSELSPRLIHPTPAKLREECVAVFTAGVKRRDQATLNTFFGRQAGEDAGLKAIEKFDTDKFRPLWKFMTGRINDTDIKNIELLAWLIDFEPRPFEYGKRYDVQEASFVDDADKKTQEKYAAGKSTIQEPANSNPETQLRVSDANRISSNKNRFTSKIKTGIIAIVILMVAGIGTCVLQNDKTRTMGLIDFKTGEGCMYWVGDHYKQVSCSEKHGDTLVIGLDTFRLKHFMKINNPDTITPKSIGSVWYLKINDTIEYFTAGGLYPTDPNRKLKPITLYMIKTHIHPDIK